ncbi:hypothetical protein NLI96_g12442 [Meripilus lineatus]|uniref:Uncharacterized protein n=1 Tax=Meripilus lineatus TaxID=2056292 RepID=A0AAD5YCF2_9APHY|nr:hypothetical protein NLI96_g12442 [Physisporinus lineatus]
MKVIIPAIVGHVPDDMVRCLVAFLDFCYLARRPSHTLEDFTRMQDSLDRFHQLRVIFIAHGIRPDEFSLPRQHALSHYIPSIKLFGSPNGLCSSLTESKHIVTVKKPWRASSRHNPLKQILDTNVRMTKISAARIDFGHRGMLNGMILTITRDISLIAIYLIHQGQDDEDDVEGEDGPEVDVITRLAVKPVSSTLLARLPQELNCPYFVELCRRFLFGQIYDDPDLDADLVELENCPMPDDHVRLFSSASSIFYCPE